MRRTWSGWSTAYNADGSLSVFDGEKKQIMLIQPKKAEAPVANREAEALVRKAQEEKALAEARAQALELEARAYKISKEVYDQTPPSVGP